MITRCSFFAAFVLAALSAAQGADLPAQSASKSAPGSNANVAMVLRVAGDISQPLNLTSEEFAKLPRQTVRAKAHDGKESQFEGVSLVDVLAKAGVPTGKDLRGPAMSLYVVAEASDGYRATFALAEIDSAFTDRVILLADRRDGKVLSAREGPLQMIVPGEKKHARWVRQVIRLKVGRG
jgi:DMSO/TMAO reductase YedYZ molybdopterin-dependent catalytic subunit